MISPEIAWDARMIDCASSSAFDGEALVLWVPRSMVRVCVFEVAGAGEFRSCPRCG